jgi:hypothetical protein
MITNTLGHWVRPYGKLLGLDLCGLRAAVVVWCLRALVRLVLCTKRGAESMPGTPDDDAPLYNLDALPPELLTAIEALGKQTCKILGLT